MSAVLKKEVVPKKVIRNNHIRTVEPVSKKVLPKKKIARKASTKSILTEAKPRKRVSKKIVVDKVAAPETVFVPSTASLRLLEKAELYRVWYKNNFPAAVARVAQAGGYTFVLLGTILATATYFVSHNVSDYRAAVVCAQEVCTEVADSDLPPSAPLVVFNSPIPELLHNDTDFIIQVQNASNFKVYLKNISTGVKQELQFTEAQPDNSYRYLLSPQNLSAAAYLVVAEAVTLDATYKFYGSQFSVPSIKVADEAEVEVIDEITTTSETLSAAVENSPVVTQEEANAENNTSVIQEPEGILLLEEELSAVDTQNEEGILPEETDVQTNAATPITATIKGSTNTSYLQVNTGNLLPSKVQVFSLVESSEQPLYLGLATLVQGEWIFSLSALELPSVFHLVYAQFDVDGLTYRSEGVSFIPRYDNTLSSLVEGDISILVQKVNISLLGFETQYQERNNFFSGLGTSSKAQPDRSYEEQFAAGELLDILDETMQREAVAIDTVLKQHAHITQVGKKYLLTLSNRAIDSQANVLAQLVSESMGDRSVIPTLNTVLSLRYKKLLEQVVERENQLNLDTSSLIARDSDQDGVSDYDEILSYSTNPSYPDTDSDGVTDAIEIITGSDPLVSDVRMIATAGASLEDVNYDEVVLIEQVEPLIIRNTNTADDSVYALVHGKSIPNSYVYVISPTLGTVGVIKANDDGVFSYTLEKAVTDGKHEIYAALTDRDGRVVASSRPQVFTKTQNTFLASAISSQVVSFDSSDPKILMQLSTTTTALGVVALGLILLILTHSLRSRPKVTLGQAK